MSKHQVLLLFLFCFSFSIFGKNEISRVSLKFYNTDELTRIPEYFSGKEYTGNRIYCRSNEEKEGLYFSFSINKDLRFLPLKTNIILSIIRLGRTEIKQFNFPFPTIEKGKREIFLGLTGKDWTSEAPPPIAWQIEFKNPQGKLLARKKSFLWDHD